MTAVAQISPVQRVEPAPATPAAILTELDVLRAAAHALAQSEALRKALRANEAELRTLCRQYDAASGTRGFAPYHLRAVCEARGLLPIPRIGD